MRLWKFCWICLLAFAFCEIISGFITLFAHVTFDTLFFLVPIYCFIMVGMIYAFSPKRIRRNVDIPSYNWYLTPSTQIWVWRSPNQVGPDEYDLFKMSDDSNKIWKRLADFPKMTGIELFKVGDERTEWYKNGLLHNDAGPALVQKISLNTSREIEEWWVNGVRHRTDGPALTHWDSKSHIHRQYWMQNNKFHRIGGPAVITDDTREWWENGKRHRRDGPAVEYEDGTKEWIFEGREIEPMELFELLTPEEQDKVIWDLNNWK